MRRQLVRYTVSVTADVTTVAVRCVITAAPRFAHAFNFGEDSISLYGTDAVTGQLRTRGSAFSIDPVTGALTGKTHQPQNVGRATQLATLGAVL